MYNMYVHVVAMFCMRKPNIIIKFDWQDNTQKMSMKCT